VLLLFLIFGWYAYFTTIRWLSLAQVSVGFSRQLLSGLFSVRVTLVWVALFLGGVALVFLMDDFFIFVSWLFF